MYREPHWAEGHYIDNHMKYVCFDCEKEFMMGEKSAESCAPGFIITSRRDVIMRLFIKCLKESLRYYFGRDGVVTNGVISVVIAILVCSAVLLAMLGIFYITDWIANKILSIFCIDNYYHGLIFLGCLIALFLIILGLLIFAADVHNRMLIEKEDQIMLAEESESSEENRK